MKKLQLVVTLSLTALLLSGCSRLPFLERLSPRTLVPKKVDIAVNFDPAVTLGEDKTSEIKVPVSSTAETSDTTVPLDTNKVMIKPVTIMVSNLTQSVLTGVRVGIPSLPPFVFLTPAEVRVLTDVSTPQETMIGLPDINPGGTTSFRLGIYTFSSGTADLVIRVKTEGGFSGESAPLRLIGIQ